MKTDTTFHGSDLEKIEHVYHIPKESIVNFAANVNPLGISYKLRELLPQHLDVISSYPDREYTSLRRAIASYVHTDYEHIWVGNGSTELISLMAHIQKPKNALILGPTYSEYQHEILLAGGHATEFLLEESSDFTLDIQALEVALQDVDFLVICNPNNPTSSCLQRDTMETILHICEKQNTFVLVDETYVEFAPSYEEVTAVPLTEQFANLMVLRGVSKFFAAPGLRLGYAICSNQQLLQACKAQQNPWSIHSLAVSAGEIMLQDTQYIQDTYTLIHTERERICHLLDKHASSIKYYTPYANFILVKLLGDTSAHAIFEKAIKQGMMLRDCSTFTHLDTHYLRFCFMKPKDNDRLLHVLLDD